VTDPTFLTVLGGGPAGLAAGYFARQRAWSCRILEAADHVGGNCVTRQVGEYRFDLGAHRFHDKDPEITAVVKRLLGDELRRVSAASAICLDGRFLKFPPSARELLRYLGGRRFAAAGAGVLAARMTSRRADSLESLAVRAYGPTIARLFLLNYSEKLWGAPCSQLSPRASGGRLDGLRLSTLLKSANVPSPHLDGPFYYPSGGYGRIATRLAEACGPDTIRAGARVTRLVHDGNRIRHVELNGRECIPVDQVVVTLPLGTVVKLFDPPLSGEVRLLAETIRFRHLLLVVWLLDRPSVTSYATIYFPDRDVPFTRVFEPRNRSTAMSPPGKTSLAIEMPCNQEDAIWQADDRMIVEIAKPALMALGWIDARSIVDACVARVPNAYPVLTTDAERGAAAIVKALGQFSNLHLIGRNGLFHYGWMHTVLRMAKTLVDGLPPPRASERGEARDG
jgi:protoporphyrinogen oxidase